MSKSDESLYEQALREIEDGSSTKGLWAKAFSESLGDENKAKALYITLRVAQLRLLNGAAETIETATSESAGSKELNDDYLQQPLSEVSNQLCEKTLEIAESKKTVKRSELPYKLGLGVFFLLAIGHGWYFPELNGRHFPEYWAYYLPPTAFIWIVFNCIFYSSPTSIWPKLSFFVIYASLIASSQLGHEIAISRQKASFSSIKSAYEEFAANATDEHGLPKPYKPSNNIVPNDEQRQFEGFAKDFLHKTGELRNEFMSELAAIGWDNVLEPSRVYNDRGLKEANSMIASARKVMANSLAKNRAFMDASINDIDLLDIDEGKKEAYRASFVKGVVDAKNMLEELSVLDEQIVDEIESLLIFLDKTRKRWNVENELFVFHKDDDQEKFNEMIGNIQDFTQKQIFIRKTASEARKQKFSDAEKMLNQF